MTAEAGVTVQVTPTDDCRGIYVASTSRTRFEVRELSGGRSGAAFYWIVHGVRRGYEGHRPITSDPALVEAVRGIRRPDPEAKR